MLQGFQIASTCRFVAVWAVAAAIGLTAAGCSNIEDNQPEANAYTEDGYLGVSNSNPNLRTNPAHHNYRRDRQLMRQALREMDLERGSRITINGGEAVVLIQVEDGRTPQEKSAIRSDAYLLLKGNVPRYRYKIYVE